MFSTQKRLYTTIKVTKDSEISQWHLFTIMLYGFLPCTTRTDVYQNVLHTVKAKLTVFQMHDKQNTGTGLWFSALAVGLLSDILALH